VDIQENEEKVRSFVKSKAINYAIVIDERGDIANAYGIEGVPTFVLINKDGKGVAADYSLSGVFLRKIEEIAE
jgi:predicted DsbA family dithiol-disulfide isomerase